MKIAMLGSGFIARFYANSLLAQRAKDTLISVYSRNIEKAKQFSEDYGLSFYSDKYGYRGWPRRRRCSDHLTAQ